MDACCISRSNYTTKNPSPGDAAAHLEDLDHHLLIVGDVNGLKHFTVLPSAQLTDQLVVFLVAMVTDTETV